MISLSSVVSPVQATHGADCACRACGDLGYRDLLARCEYQRQEMARLAAEVAELRSALIREVHARLTAEMQSAIERGDKEAWAKAMAKREAAPVATPNILRSVGAL